MCRATGGMESGQVTDLLTRTRIAGVTLMAAAGVAVGGCATTANSSSAPECLAKHAAAGAAGSEPGGPANPAVAASWTRPGGNLANTRGAAGPTPAADVAGVSGAW